MRTNECGGIRVLSTAVVLSVMCSIAGCFAEVDQTEGLEEHEGEYVAGYRIGLSLGASGPDVQAVYEYLHRYGYLPNEELEATHPGWAPFVKESPEDPEVFDAVLEEALMAFQQRARMLPTGMVDVPTAELMAAPRCGEPESGAAPETLKWYLMGSGTGSNPRTFYWSRIVDGTFIPLVWNVTNAPAGLSRSQVQTAIRRAFDTWDAVSFYDFRQATAAEQANPSFVADVVLSFAPLGVGGLVAQTGSIPRSPSAGNPVRSATVTFNTSANTWTTSSTPPAGAFDVRSVALHEIGHVMLIDHSNPDGACSSPSNTCPSGPVMWWRVGTGERKRSLHTDDLIAARLVLPGLPTSPIRNATSFATGGDGSVWITSTENGNNGYKMYRFVGGSWTNIPGEAIEVGIENDGRAYHINRAGNFYKRQSDGGWARKGKKKLSHLAVGGSSIWALGQEVTRNEKEHSIYEWRSSKWNKVSGYALDIAVDSEGTPWHINEAGQVYRWTGSGWSRLPENVPGTAKSIEAGSNGTIWATSTNSSGVRQAWVWNEQDSFLDGSGNVATNAGVGWMWMRNDIKDVAMSTDHRMWALDTSNRLYRSKN